MEHRDPDFNHLNRCHLLEYGRRRESGSVNHQSVLQRDLQTLSQERNQHTRVGAMLKLMVDGANAQLTFQAAKH
jgi:hypothetical protein